MPCIRFQIHEKTLEKYPGLFKSLTQLSYGLDGVRGPVAKVEEESREDGGQPLARVLAAGLGPVLAPPGDLNQHLQATPVLQDLPPAVVAVVTQVGQNPANLQPGNSAHW